VHQKKQPHMVVRFSLKRKPHRSFCFIKLHHLFSLVLLPFNLLDGIPVIAQGLPEYEQFFYFLSTISNQTYPHFSYFETPILVII
jgi:hypothetical protein